MYTIDMIIAHSELKKKERAVLENLREEFIEEDCDKYLWRKNRVQQEDVKKTQELIDKEGRLVTNPHIIEFINQFSEIDLAKEIPFIFPQSYAPNYFLAKEICKKAKKFCLVNNIFKEDDQSNWLAVFAKEDEKSICMMTKLLYSAVFGETFGGYKLFGKGLTSYSKYLEYNGNILEPKRPNLLAHYLGNSFGKTDPLEILESRKVVKMLIRQGYFRNELDLFRNFYDVLLPFMHNWFVKAHEIEKETNYDVNLLVNTLRSELIADGVIATKWKSERMLFGEIKEIYEDALFQYRPSWLEPQSLDIYIPSLCLGVEYQGIQHYEEVNFFGGEKALIHRRALDKKKRKLCRDNNVTLLEWPYTDEISKRKIKEKLEYFRKESNAL